MCYTNCGCSCGCSATCGCYQSVCSGCQQHCCVTTSTTTTTTTLNPDCEPCDTVYDCECVEYSGPNVSCYDLKTGDNLCEILELIVSNLPACVSTTTAPPLSCSFAGIAYVPGKTTTTTTTKPTTTSTTTTSTSTSTTSTSTTLFPLNFVVSYVCNPLLATLVINANTPTGGSGTGYAFGSTVFATQAAALANTNWLAGTSIAYTLAQADGVYWVALKDSAGNVFAKSVNVVCSATTTTTTAGPTTTTTSTTSTSTTSTSTTSTTSTSTTSTSTTTTTSTSTTTTSTTTTTTAAPLLFLLGYSASAPDEACGDDTPAITYAAPGSVLQNGTVLYTNPSLTIPVPDGYYSDGTNVWYATSGVLSLQSLCNATTTTTTSTTTTTTVAPNFLSAETNDEITTEGNDPLLTEQ